MFCSYKKNLHKTYTKLVKKKKVGFLQMTETGHLLQDMPIYFMHFQRENSVHYFDVDNIIIDQWVTNY